MGHALLGRPDGREVGLEVRHAHEEEVSECRHLNLAPPTRGVARPHVRTYRSVGKPKLFLEFPLDGVDEGLVGLKPAARGVPGRPGIAFRDRSVQEEYAIFFIEDHCASGSPCVDHGMVLAEEGAAFCIYDAFEGSVRGARFVRAVNSVRQ